MLITSESYHSDVFEYSWLEDDILYFKYKENSVVKLDHVKYMLELQKELGVSKNTKRIVHASKYTTITTEARKYVQKNKPEAKAEAFILHNLAQRILFNFYVKLRERQNPIRSFNTKESAIEWIKAID